MSLLPATLKKVGSKTTEKRWRHHFLNYKSMGAFYCHGNQRFDPIYPKTLCSLSPIQMMLSIKFDQDWPTGLRDIQVWKCGRRRTTDGDGRTDDVPLVYYKLTLWACGSGELKAIVTTAIFGTVGVDRLFLTQADHIALEKKMAAFYDGVMIYVASILKFDR